MNKELTIKQERFANLYVELGNASEAYKEAYDVGENTTKESIRQLAHRELSKVHLRLRVAELKSDLGDKFKISQGYIVLGLMDIINDSEETFELGKLENADKDEVRRFFRMMNQTKNTDKLRALESLAKMLGLNEPEVVEHNHILKTYKTNWG
jgi:phage terminase small subunit